MAVCRLPECGGVALGVERLQGYVPAAQSGWDGSGDRLPIERIVFRSGHGIRLSGCAWFQAGQERLESPLLSTIRTGTDANCTAFAPCAAPWRGIGFRQTTETRPEGGLRRI